MTDGLLYIRNGRIHRTGTADEAHISYCGHMPNYVIRLQTSDGLVYMTDTAKASRMIETGMACNATLLPILD